MNGNNNNQKVPAASKVSSITSVSSSTSVAESAASLSKPPPPPPPSTTSTPTVITRYDSPPLVSSWNCLLVGFCLYVVAIKCPTLILIVAVVASKTCPQWFRYNDDAVTRRRLIRQFLDEQNAHHYEEDTEDDDDLVRTNGGGDDSSNDHSGRYSSSSSNNNTTSSNKIPIAYRRLIFCSPETGPPVDMIDEHYFENARGMLLATSIMVPKNRPLEDVAGIICFCHGYSDNASYLRRCEMVPIVVATQCACLFIDYEGHGKSDGNLTVVGTGSRSGHPILDDLVEDVAAYFEHTLRTHFTLAIDDDINSKNTMTRQQSRQQRNNKPKPKAPPVFLMGESMGGAVAYCVYEKHAHLFRNGGVIFMSPMLAIHSSMQPPPQITRMLRWLLARCPWIGYLPVTPQKGPPLDLLSFRVTAKALPYWNYPTRFGRPARLATANCLLEICQHIESSMDTFDAPFLVLHSTLR